MRVRTFLPAFLVIVFLLGVGSPVIGATVSLTAAAKGGSGLDVVVPVTVAPADGVTTMSFSFTYDPLVVNPTGVYKTAAFNSFTLTSNLFVPGTVTLALTGSTPQAGTQEAAWVVFRLLGTTGTFSNLNWVSSSLNGGAISSTTSNGKITVASASSIIATPDNSQNPLTGTVAVPISATPATGGQAFDLTVRFNQNVVNALSAAKTPLTTSMTLTSNLATPGLAIISLFGVTPITGSGPLVNITFATTGAVGTKTPMDITQGDINEGGTSTVLDDGLFTICDGTDADGDGVTGCAGDCNNFNANIKPGKPELCNGIDDNCNGTIDEGLASLPFYQDLDGDNYGNTLAVVHACAAPAGFVATPGDCNDGNAAVHPGATEVCNLIDDNCDGTVDNAPVPPGIAAVQVAPPAGSALISWPPLFGATSYDVVKGSLVTLQSSAGNFTAATTACLANNLALTSVSDISTPAANNGFWYLVRPVNCGGGGSYDSGAPSQVGLRDAEIAASGFACP
jgi:hypothetical protein